MAAELTALLPEEGGYYVWVREAFGSFCAVQQACWTMIVSVVWLAMYPVLFVGYFGEVRYCTAGPLSTGVPSTLRTRIDSVSLSFLPQTESR